MPSTSTFLNGAKNGLHGKGIFLILLFCFVPGLILLRVLLTSVSNYFKTEVWSIQNGLFNTLYYTSSLAFLLLLVRYFHKLPIDVWLIESRTFNIKSACRKGALSFIFWTLSVFIFSIWRDPHFLANLQNFQFFKLHGLFNIAALVVFEEVFFRAYLLQQIYALVNNILFTVISVSALFSLVHFESGDYTYIEQFWLFCYYFIVSAVLCLFAILGNGIAISIGIHFANNLLAHFSNYSLNLTNITYSSESTQAHILVEIFYCIISALVMYWIFQKTQQIAHYKILNTSIKS